MKTLNKLSGLSVALLMVASYGSAYAEVGDKVQDRTQERLHQDADVTQTRTQDRLHQEVNLQTPTADFGQARNREEKAIMNQDPAQNEYKSMQKYQRGMGNSGAASMNHQMMTREVMSRPTSGGRR